MIINNQLMTMMFSHCTVSRCRDYLWAYLFW